jgi:amino acid adenylation domain-containing protein
MELQGVTVTPIEKQVTASEYDISIEFKREAGLLSMCVEYSEELFHGKRIQRLVNHFQHILERLDTLNPQPLSAISLLGKEEEILLGYTFSNAGFPAIPYKSIAGMFEAAVQQFADKTAIVMQDEAFTYRQINERSNQLAHLFRNKYGILAEGRIGIMMARSAEQIIVMLAVIKAGAAFVPLEPGLPLDRIEYILRDSDLELLVTDNDEHKFTFLTKDKILHISASGWPAADYPAYNPGIRPVLSQLAYIIYTSGSTGLPKGVMIEYGSLERYVCQFIDFFSISAADVIIHQSSISFDLSIEEIFPALSTGGKVVIIKDGGMDIAAIISSIHKEQVSVISITPMILNELNKTDYQQLKSLRAIICGGDKIQAGQLNRLLDKTAIYNTYGPTESTVCATYHKIESLNGLDIIGKPLVNREVFIVDSNMNLEPIGIPGEICIGGDGLARGYLNQQDLTNRSFISNKSGKGRLFRTGDTGYWNEEGCIVFTGRNDYQVKIRGYRVETGEIESRLHQLEGVISCVVSVYQNEKQINQLIAYVVSNSKTKDDIRDYLGKYLPAYMVPAYIMLVDKIPQTVTGKADRKALPAPETGRGTTEIQAMAPRNDTEEKLTVIWEKALERNGIGMTDNFFEIGGHSLSAMRIIAEIAAMFAVKIELRSLFQYPTIAGLARLIISGREQSYQKIVKVREQDYYPASAAQQRLWIVDQVDEKRIAYNMVAAYKLKGPLKKDIVEKTLFALVDRHESLRTTFIMTGGQLQQRISSLHESGARLCFTDFTGQDNIDGCTEEYLVKEINTPFDLETGPLLRASLLQTGEDMFVIVFSIHHIISDGRSSVILINEFISLYNSECTRGEAALPWLAIQYKDYSAWQLSRMQDKEMIEHAGYWKHQLQEPLPVLNMVTDFPRPAVRTYQGKTMKFMLDESLAERVKGLGYQYDVSLFITLLSMATVFLHKYTGQDDIITGVPVSGRTDKDTEGIVGFFVNSLPVRTRFRITDSFEDILLQVKESVLAGYAHQDYPFDLMVEELSSKAEKGRSPVFDIMVLLENNGGNEKKFADMDGVEVFDVELPDMTSKFDLTFNFIENGPGISLHISYDTALFKEVSIMLLFRKFIQLAGRLVQNAGVALTDVDITTAEENELAQSLFDIPFNIDG